MIDPSAAPVSVPRVPRWEPTVADVTAASAPADSAVTDRVRVGRSSGGDGVAASSEGRGCGSAGVGVRGGRVLVLMVLPR